MMILNALDGKPLPVYGDGMQIRDWLLSKTTRARCIRLLPKVLSAKPTTSAVTMKSQY